MAQARRISRHKKPSPTIHAGMTRFLSELLRETSFWILAALALAMIAALYTFNPNDPAWTHTAAVDQIHNIGDVYGAWFADIAFYFFGYPAYLLPLGILLIAWRLFRRKRLLHLDAEVILFRLLGFTVMLATACGLATLHWQVAAGVLPNSGSAGGLVGIHLSQFLTHLLGSTGGSLFILLLFLAGGTLAASISWLKLLDQIGDLTLKLVDEIGALILLPLRLVQPAKKKSRTTEEPDPPPPANAAPTPGTPPPNTTTKSSSSKSSRSKSAPQKRLDQQSAADHFALEPESEIAPLPATATLLPQAATLLPQAALSPPNVHGEPVHSPQATLLPQAVLSAPPPPTATSEPSASLELRTLLPTASSLPHPSEPPDIPTLATSQMPSTEPSQLTMIPSIAPPPPPMIPTQQTESVELSESDSPKVASDSPSTSTDFTLPIEKRENAKTP